MNLNDIIIPKAKDAYEMTLENINNSMIQEIHKIGELIKEAINKGEFEITLYNQTISKNVRNAIENNGYTVKTQFAMNETDTTISWEEPNKVYRSTESDIKEDPCEKCGYKPMQHGVCAGCEEKIKYESSKRSK